MQLDSKTFHFISDANLCSAKCKNATETIWWLSALPGPLPQLCVVLQQYALALFWFPIKLPATESIQWMRLTLHAYADAEADAYADALIKKTQYALVLFWSSAT